MFKWITSLVLWVFISENREVGLSYTKKALDMAEIVAENTKTTKDDKILLFLKKNFEKAVALNNLSAEDTQKIANTITKVAKGGLKNIAIGIKKGKIEVSLGGPGVNFGITL